MRNKLGTQEKPKTNEEAKMLLRLVDKNLLSISFFLNISSAVSASCLNSLVILNPFTANG